jgi:hypothetical protein
MSGKTTPVSNVFFFFSISASSSAVILWVANDATSWARLGTQALFNALHTLRFP